MKRENMLKLLKELVRNSKRSDREIAKTMGASQPTVTRTRKLLEKYIRSYTIVPDFNKIGYELLAFTFAKAKTYNKEVVDKHFLLAKEWLAKQHNVVFASDGEGVGKDTVIVALHKNYSAYADFMREYIVVFADGLSDVQSFIVSLETGLIMKPFDLTYLAADIQDFVKE